MQSEPYAFDRRDVDAFMRHAWHVVNTGGVDRVAHDDVAHRLAVMGQELDQRQPRWDLLRTQGLVVRELLRVFAAPATVMAIDGLRWP